MEALVYPRPLLNAKDVVPIQLRASDRERQIAEAIAEKARVQRAVQNEDAAAPVDSAVEEVTIEGEVVEAAVIVQAADQDEIAGAW